MPELSKTEMKQQAQDYLWRAVHEAIKREKEQRLVHVIPTRQWEEFDEILEKQAERIEKLFGLI